MRHILLVCFLAALDASPSSSFEDEVGVGSAFRVLVAGPSLSVGVGWRRTLGERLHHLCKTHRKEAEIRRMDQ